MHNRLRDSLNQAAVGVALFSVFAMAGAPVPAHAQGQAREAPQASQANTFLELLTQANEKTKAKQWAEAAQLWAKVAQLNPVEGDVWDQLAKARYETRDYRGAIPAFEKAFELGSDFPCRQAYNVARCYGMLGEKEQAMKWVEKAFALGYRRLDVARNDPALSLLHSNARFQTIAGLVDTFKMTRDEGWRYDLQFLSRELKRRSYDPFRRISREEFEATVKRVNEAIPKLTDLQISIEFMKFVAKGSDAHTMVLGFFERPEFLQTIPVDLFLFEEGLFITEADSRYQDLLGAQVLRFGSRTIPEVLESLDPIISRDNKLSALKVMGLMRMRNLPLLHALGLIPEPDKVSLSIIDREGKARSVTLPADARIPSRKIWAGLPAGWKSFKDLGPGPLPLYMKNIYAPYWFEYLPDKKLVYFQFNRVMDDTQESLAQFSDRLFKFI